MKRSPDAPANISGELEHWLGEEGPRTLGDLVRVFGERSYAVLFIVLLSLPALPLPTGGLTHVFEVIAMLAAVQLLAGRRSVWLPARWRRLDLRGRTGERVGRALVSRLRWLERYSRPRLPYLTLSPPARALYGALVLAFSMAAFVAPPFSGLDTLPALGVVVMSLGVMLGDFLLVAAGALVGFVGIAAVIGFGGVVVRTVGDLF